MLGQRRDLIRMGVSFAIGVVLTVLVLFSLPVVRFSVSAILDPPPSLVTPLSPSVAIRLIDLEAQAARTRNTSLVAEIYSDEAVITDAACLSKQPDGPWVGLPEITNRYTQLPTILTLEHVEIVVQWNSDDARTTIEGTATSLTVGTLKHDTPPGYENLGGRDAWAFALQNGQWKITSFTYGLCLS